MKMIRIVEIATTVISATKIDSGSNRSGMAGRGRAAGPGGGPACAHFLTTVLVLSCFGFLFFLSFFCE